ncbi:MAG: ankyrin repeat domain-containing protein [Gammaproteobacteria bacterium]|nr:ankyrin repeat domain-containing protein [Gammaproteobacteria bacterium]
MAQNNPELNHPKDTFNWCGLPPELMLSIAFFTTYYDYLSLSITCKKMAILTGTVDLHTASFWQQQRRKNFYFVKRNGENFINSNISIDRERFIAVYKSEYKDFSPQVKRIIRLIHDRDLNALQMEEITFSLLENTHIGTINLIGLIAEKKDDTMWRHFYKVLKNENKENKKNLEEIEFAIDSCDLPLAVSFNQIEAVKKILEISTQNLNCHSENGYMPLHLAVKYGLEEMARLLIEKGANVNVAPGTLSPIHVACRHGHLDILKMLVNEFNADIHASHYINGKRELPLNYGLVCGHLSIIDFLFSQYSFDRSAHYVKRQSNTAGESILRFAASRGYFHIVQSVLNHANFTDDQFENAISASIKPLITYVLLKAQLASMICQTESIPPHIVIPAHRTNSTFFKENSELVSARTLLQQLESRAHITQPLVYENTDAGEKIKKIYTELVKLDLKSIWARLHVDNNNPEKNNNNNSVGRG